MLNRANASDTDVSFLDLHLSISSFVSSKNAMTDFQIVIFHFLDGDDPPGTSLYEAQIYVKLIGL